MMKSPFQAIPSVLQVVIKVLGESVKVEPDFLTFTCTKDVIYEFNKFFLAFFVLHPITLVHSEYRTSSELVEFIPIKPTGSPWL